MINFKPIKDITTEAPILSAEQFDDSDFGGSNTLLGVADYQDMLFAHSEEEEELSELYYFLEGNANHEKRDGNMLLVTMDEVRYILFDFHGEQAVAIHKSNKAIAENLL